MWNETDKGSSSLTEIRKYGLDWFYYGWFYGWFGSIPNYIEMGKGSSSFTEISKL